VSLRQKFLTFIFTIFFSVGVLTLYFVNDLIIQINEQWAEKLAKQHLNFDKQKALLPIMNEVKLVKKLAHEQSIIDMALHEQNATLLKNGLATLEHYKELFANKSYFIALSNSRHYYYNDAKNSRKGRECIATLDINNKNDSWFFQTIKKGGEFYLNVDKDTNLGVTNIWINYNIIHNNKIIGIVGTGFNLTKFIKLFVKTNNPNDYNIFFDNFLSIQLYQDTKLIDYASISKDSSDHISLISIIQDKQEVRKVQEVVSVLKQTKGEEIKTLWLNIDGKKYLASISYIPELDWFDMMAIEVKSLPTIGLDHALVSASIIMLVLFTLFVLFNELKIIRPIKQITTNITNIAKNGYNTQIRLLKGNDEIAQLSKEFQALIKLVQKENSRLEGLVKNRTEELYTKQQFLNTIMDNANVYIYTKDMQLRYTYINKAGLKALGNLLLEDVIGTHLEDVYDTQTIQEIEEIDKEVIARGVSTSFEEEISFQNQKSKYLLVTKTPLFDKDNNIYALLGIALDITQRKEQENTIKEMAFYDSLTKLPNRRFLEEKIANIIEQKRKKYGALMFIDIDDFKSINDTYTHKVGDMLLKEVATRLQNTIRSSDTVARLGGDEFVIAIEELEDDYKHSKQQALAIANKILLKTNQVYMLEHNADSHIKLSSTLSIGITLFHEDEPIDAIFQRADKAMYKVKKEQKNGVYLI